MQTLFHATWFKILLLIFGLILLGLGIFVVWAALNPTLPAGYRDTLSAIGTESTGLGKLFGEDLQQSVTGLVEKETARNWTEAAQIVGNAMAVITEISSGTDSLKSDVTKFKSLSEKIKKADVKEKSLNLANLLEQWVAHLEEMVRLENQILTPTKAYYEDLAAGRTATVPANLDADGASLNSEASAFADLGSQIVSATTELNASLGTAPAK